MATQPQRRRTKQRPPSSPAKARRANLPPIEVKLVPGPTEAQAESFGKKLVGGALIVLLTGAMAFATAMWTGAGQESVSDCEIARDIVMDDQLNPGLNERERRAILSEAVVEVRSCLDD